MTMEADDGFRVVTKRRNPFGEGSNRQLKMHVIDPEAVAYNNGINTVDSGVADLQSCLDDTSSSTSFCAGMAGLTLQRLMQAGRDQAALHQKSSPSADVAGKFVGSAQIAKCWVCMSTGEAAACAFCEREACERCMRQCDRCQDTFCTFCSTAEYVRPRILLCSCIRCYICGRIALGFVILYSVHVMNRAAFTIGFSECSYGMLAFPCMGT